MENAGFLELLRRHGFKILLFTICILIAFISNSKRLPTYTEQRMLKSMGINPDCPDQWAWEHYGTTLEYMGYERTTGKTDSKR